MRLSPVTWFGSLAAGAVGATVAVVLLGGHSAPQQPTYVLHQDAQTSVAVITDSAPDTAAATTTSAKQAPAVQEAPVVTDPTTAGPANQATAPADTYIPPNPQTNPDQPPPVRSPRSAGPTCVNATTGEAC